MLNSPIEPHSEFPKVANPKPRSSTMKPSAIFDRWMKDNAEQIASDGKEFQKLIAFALFDLRMIEGNRKGLIAPVADDMIQRFAKLRTQIASRGMKPPEMELPKIKIIQPAPRRK